MKKVTTLGRLIRIMTTHGTDTIQNNLYSYDLLSNLAARTDSIHGMSESFIYDNLNRLTGIVEGNDTTGMFVYDAYGRMLSKYIHGAQVFDSAEYNGGNRPHAIAQAKTPLDLPVHQMSYTHFDKLAFLGQDTVVLRYGYGFGHERLHLTETDLIGDTLRQKDYVGNCEYVTNDSDTIAYTYLSGPLGVFGVQEEYGNATQHRYFIHPDHLGSWTLIADNAANIVQDVAFDVWGTPYRFTATGTVPADSLLFDRGFTGHEHLLYFGLINMNGRMYDPFTSGFLSVDNYVQSPGYTQSFNRYAYCLNNPLKYTDPSGELFGTLFGVVSDIVNNVFVRTFKGEKWDWTQTKLGWNIDKGLFHTDSNKSNWGRAWEIASRFIWQAPQTLTGDLFVSTANAFGAVNDVTHNYGITAVDMGLNSGAVTIGNYTAGPNGYKADWHDHLFVHEYGHYIQSQQHGPVYLLTVGIPSLQSAIIQTNNPSSPKHKVRWFESDASYKGAEYFDNYYGSNVEGYYMGNPDYFDKESFIYGTEMPYINPRTNSRYEYSHPITGVFHWTDIPIYIPIIGLIPALFYL